MGRGEVEMEEIDYIGVLNCNVEGYMRPCKAYLWRVAGSVTKGLIVDAEDIHSIKYAEEQLKKKPLII